MIIAKDASLCAIFIFIAMISTLLSIAMVVDMLRYKFGLLFFPLFVSITFIAGVSIFVSIVCTSECLL